MTDLSEQAIPKLCDFGLSIMIGPNQKSKDPYGTVGYCAPEIIREQPYSQSVDYWSLGCTVYALLCG
jgi:protein-serine/threonine kinase